MFQDVREISVFVDLFVYNYIALNPSDSIPGGNSPRVWVDTIKLKQIKVEQNNFELLSQEIFPGEIFGKFLVITVL